MTRHILHVSDIHFGRPHIPARSQAVLDLIRDRQPDLVVISGDLTQRAKPREFREAREFVDQIEVPSICVPGNHDVPMYRVWERVFAPYGAYRKHFSSEMEPVYSDPELFVVGVNTAFNWTIKDGRIKLDRLVAVSEQLETADPEQCRIVVAHHHLTPPPRFGTQRVLANAQEGVDLFSKSGVELVLSGHQHQAYISSSEEFYPSGRPPVAIVHSGTTTSNRGRGAESSRNTCNWLTIDRDHIRISQLTWERSLDRFVEYGRHLYPRLGRRPYALDDVQFSPGPAGAST